MNERVWIVEDEEDIAELLRHHLIKEGFAVQCIANGEIAMDRINQQGPPELLILDLMLPGMGGLEVCRQIRSGGAGFPIIMVTAKGSEQDVVMGLEMGADDYIVKPFSLPVLMARVRRALSRQNPRKSHGELADCVVQGSFTIDTRRREVKVGEDRKDLTSSEFALLHFLASHPGWVYTRAQIVKAVHGDDYPVTERSVDVMVLSLRRKLGEPGRYIETVRGVGYRFAES